MARRWKRENIEQKEKDIKTVKELSEFIRELWLASIEDALWVSLTKEEKVIFNLIGYGYSPTQIAILGSVSLEQVSLVVEKIADIVETGKYKPILKRVA